MKTRYTQSGFGKRNPKSDNNWTPLELDGYRITKPSIICLGGNGTTDFCKAKRFCATAERWMNLSNHRAGSCFSYDSFDILGFHYGMDSKDDTTGYFSKEYISKIVDNLLLPLCVDKNGERLKLENACKNFTLVTFFCHCHGAREINYILSELNTKLINKGYTAEEVNKIYGQSFQLSYSPMPDEAWLPSVRIDSFTDSFNLGLASAFKDAYGYRLNGVAVMFDRKGMFRTTPAAHAHHDKISIYSSRLVNTEENKGYRNIIDEHTIEVLERNSDWTIANNAKNAECVSRMGATALARAVANSVKNKKYKEFYPKSPIKSLESSFKTILSKYSEDDLKMVEDKPTSPLLY